jgi:hypothetical protein
MKGKVLVGGLVALIVVLLGLAQGKIRAEEDKDLKEDLRKLQGKWEHAFTVKGEQGREIEIRKVKEIKDEKETVTWYLPGGKVYQVNQVDIKLEKKGKDRIFTYTNWKFLEGPDKGKEIPGKGSFVYKIDGDVWTEVAETDDGKIEVQWKRVKEKKED